MSPCLRGSNFFRGSKIFLVGISWIRNFFFVGISWVQFFSRDISWVQNFFSWVSLGVEFFSFGYFVGPNFFLMDVLQVPREYTSKK